MISLLNDIPHLILFSMGWNELSVPAIVEDVCIMDVTLDAAFTGNVLNALKGGSNLISTIRLRYSWFPFMSL